MDKTNKERETKQALEGRIAELGQIALDALNESEKKEFTRIIRKVTDAFKSDCINEDYPLLMSFMIADYRERNKSISEELEKAEKSVNIRTGKVKVSLEEEDG